MTVEGWYSYARASKAWVVADLTTVLVVEEVEGLLEVFEWQP
jgi:hypothetical protein